MTGLNTVSSERRFSGISPFIASAKVTLVGRAEKSQTKQLHRSKSPLMDRRKMAGVLRDPKAT